MTSVLGQEKGSVLPSDVTEGPGLSNGSDFSYKKRRGPVIMKKVRREVDGLLKSMSWKPKRRGKLRPVKEKEIKEIWG